MLEIAIAILVGIFFGIFTGLCPGIHINLVSAFLIFSLASLLKIASPLSLAIFIVAMSISHTFFDFIPSVYLGAPDDSGLATMPGHALLLKGRGHLAVIHILLGALLSVFICIALIPLLLYITPLVYPFLNRMMSLLLILTSCFMIFNEKESKVWALIIFCLAGFLGLATLNLKVSQPLLPLLSGLFGSSSLIYSLNQKTSIPRQKISFKIKKKKFIKPLLASPLISPFCAFLPGLGGSQAAVLSSQVCKQTRKQFLILLGSVSVITMTLSFVALFSIDKARTGSAAAIQDILKINSTDLFWIFTAVVISALVSFFLALKISKIFAKNIHKISYSKISLAVLGILTLGVIIFSSWLGILIFICSTCLGLLAIETRIRKSNLMACLLISTILFYLPIW